MQLSAGVIRTLARFEVVHVNWLLVPVFAFILVLSVFVTLSILHGVSGFLWDEHRWLLISGLLLVGSFLASLFRPTRGTQTSGDERMPLHAGIRIHAFPVAGPMGFVVMVGVVVMFWFGLPGARPVVVMLAAVGLTLGALLVWLDRRRAAKPAPSPSILKLTARTDASAPEATRIPLK